MIGGWASLLLAFAGRIPDAAVASARTALAAGDAAAAVEALAAAARLPAAEIEAFAAAGPDVVMRAFDAHGDLRGSGQRFTPLTPDTGPLNGLAAELLDEPAILPDFAGQETRLWIDRAAARAVAAVGAEQAAVGLWSSVRRGGLLAAGRVFLVEIADDDVTGVTGRLQDLLIGNGTLAVEVYQSGADLPDYHRRALGAAALLWARSDVRPEVVPVFDGVDDAGRPRFDRERARLPRAEWNTVAGYLGRATEVLATTARMADVVDPRRGEVVPLAYRTDGRYVWSDAVTYYVRNHGVAPFPPLLERIRAARHQPPQADGVAMFRAENALFAPASASH